ncbi:hypothetical protein ARMSODRAFT_851426, partial [Armillaria solidipes]
MLAPLLDKMVTRTISNRFTASEALQFFEDLLPDTLVPSDALTEHYEQCDRWKDLLAEFIQRWSAYREPPVPRTTMWLRKISRWGTGYQ